MVAGTAEDRHCEECAWASLHPDPASCGLIKLERVCLPCVNYKRGADICFVNACVYQHILQEENDKNSIFWLLYVMLLNLTYNNI